MLGMISRYNYEKMYGFILGDDSQEYFFANADFKNHPKKIKGKRVRFNIEVSEQNGKHLRATNIVILSSDVITMAVTLNIESADPYPQEIGRMLKNLLEQEIEKLNCVEGVTINSTLSVGRSL